MAEPRPFPPSPRRLALARASGLTAASPLLAGAAAAVALVGATVVLARAAAARIGHWIAAACRAADGTSTTSTSPPPMDGPMSGATSTVPAAARPLDGLASAVLELALPLLAAAAVAALLVHLAQTRALWLPRRTLPGAPTLPRRDVRRTMLDVVGTTVVGAVCVGWLFATAPRLASLALSSPSLPALAHGTGAALASLLVALAIAWVALGVLDALVRHVQLASALAMTRDDKREDDRLAAADPRWRAQRLAIARGGSLSDAVARSIVLVLGDDTAVAIAFDPIRQPTPVRTATGRRARATQLLALARRHRVAVHRDVELAARLVEHEGPVPESEWRVLADVVAAVRR